MSGIVLCHDWGAVEREIERIFMPAVRVRPNWEGFTDPINHVTRFEVMSFGLFAYSAFRERGRYVLPLEQFETGRRIVEERDANVFCIGEYEKGTPKSPVDQLIIPLMLGRIVR